MTEGIQKGEQTYSSAISEATNYSAWVISLFSKYLGDSLLEVGVGHGAYRNYLPDRINYTGIDFDAESILNAKQMLPNDHYQQIDITDTLQVNSLADRKIDSIICANVLEHIEDDDLAISNLLSILSEGGHLMLFVPAFAALYSEMDHLAGHHRRYRKSDMRKLADNKPCAMIENYYVNPIGGVGWWVNKYLGHKDLNSNSINNQIIFFDKYVLPVSKLINPISRHMFGQSLATVLQKK